MDKEELLRQLKMWQEEMAECKEFLKTLAAEPLMGPLFQHGVSGFLVTAAEYLEMNLDQIATRLRMK